MKITIDSETNNIKVGNKVFNDVDEYVQSSTISAIRSALLKNSNLSDYEEDCMWMSYRYCIGRHTIASTMHAGAIWKNCKGRMSDERSLFTAFDINREIERCLQFHKPYFHFPLTSFNRIYTSAIDIVCEFMEDYNVKSIDDFIKYRDIHIILTDNERGYKFEVVTWEEWLKPQILSYCKRYYAGQPFTEDDAWNNFLKWKEGKITNVKFYEDITKDMPNKDHYFMYDFEDLFAWNDLVHCFDFEHHHKSILVDGSECTWFWSWTNNTEKHKDGNYYTSFGYHKIRVPLDRWNGNVTTYIPDDSIKEDIY